VKIASAKERLSEWLSGFIGVMCELSGESFAQGVSANRAVLRVPSDVFSALKSRRAIEKRAGAFVFVFQSGDIGKAVVKVIADEELKNCIILTVQDFEK
jgi:hypothetical protein